MRAPNRFPGCSSCINKICDPFQCSDCVRESHWEGVDGDGANDEDTVEVLSLAELKNLIGDR